MSTYPVQEEEEALELSEGGVAQGYVYLPCAGGGGGTGGVGGRGGSGSCLLRLDP